jgi:hypothetical protein
MPETLYPWIRPPAVPLITHDPYFCIWSMDDRLTGGWARHWTGSEQRMLGVAVIDGQPYRFLGSQLRQREMATMKQTSLQVWPLRTLYTFEAAGLCLKLTFLSPLLAEDLDLAARPVTYLTAEVQAVDGQPHPVEIFFSIAAVTAAENRREEVVWARHRLGELNALSAASAQQRVLERSGDNLRIEWGSLYLAAPGDETELWPGFWYTALSSLLDQAAFPDADDMRMPRQAADEEPHLAARLRLGTVGAQTVSRTLLLAYDDQYSIEYLQTRLRPYWRRNGMDAGELLRTAWAEYPQLSRRCQAFDEELMSDLAAAGGEQYAVLCALAYRQAVAAHKLVAAPDGTPLFFSKENFSNGCIATIDVTYPSAPLFLLLNPRLLKGMLTPILDYAMSARWKFPFAPHDLGRYPLANGQVYGGGERIAEDQMPVEESGNVLILLAALAEADGNAEYARQYLPVLKRWADYLVAKGLDPEDQLCTDDFAGHLAHNTNLAIKAILGLAGYARLLEGLGEEQQAQGYRRQAEQMAKAWQSSAGDGDHYRLTFDRPGTWSQKYNLVWDALLGFNLFPAEIARQEVSFYLQRQQQFGLPLDSRRTYTKLDWIIWSASLAEQAADFRALVAPLHAWAHQTPDRAPLPDWYETTDGHVFHFRARSVVGGLFFPVLKDRSTWRKWLARVSEGSTNL